MRRSQSRLLDVRYDVFEKRGGREVEIRTGTESRLRDGERFQVKRSTNRLGTEGHGPLKRVQRIGFFFSYERTGDVWTFYYRNKGEKGKTV